MPPPLVLTHRDVETAAPAFCSRCQAVTKTRYMAVGRDRAAACCASCRYPRPGSTSVPSIYLIDNGAPAEITRIHRR